MSIHPTAVIDAKAELDGAVEIGPYVVIEGRVKIGRGTRVRAHAYLTGWTEIGEDNEIHPGAVLGNAAQDRASKGEESYLRIGSHNIIREYAQIHRGTTAGSETRIGNHNFLMAQRMWGTIASSATTSSWPTAHCWGAMSKLAITFSSRATV